MRQPEAKLKTALREGFEAACPHGWYNYQPPTFVSKRGVPDLLFIAPALSGPVWVEAKVGAKFLTPSQAATVPKMIAGGARVCLLSWDEHTLDAPKAKRLAWLQRLAVDPAGSAVGGSSVLQFSWPAFSDPSFWHNMGTIR